MILLRALLFNFYFFGVTFLLCFPGSLVRIFLPGKVLAYAKWWCGLMLAGARVICGIQVRITGLEYLPQDGPALLASQHQSAFDTLVWMTLLQRPSYVVKRELTRIPMFGPLLTAAGMISVNRKAGAAALRALLQATDAARAGACQIVIFPEGTRVSPGEQVTLQPGIAAIATRLALPVLPVATDSGLRWGRRAFMKYPGVIHIAIGPPLPAGTPRAALLAAIESHWRRCAATEFTVVDNSVGGGPITAPGQPELYMTER
jgi:1-acyl-sn-glycerol-3-phosphate acyltransferase